MAFSTAVLCNQHHYLVPEHFHHQKGNSIPMSKPSAWFWVVNRCFLPLPSPFPPCQSQWTARSLLILLPPPVSTFSWTSHVLPLSKMLHWVVCLVNALRALTVEESDIDPILSFSIVGQLLFFSLKSFTLVFSLPLMFLSLPITCPEVQFSSLSLFITPWHLVFLLL